MNNALVGMIIRSLERKNPSSKFQASFGGSEHLKIRMVEFRISAMVTEKQRLTRSSLKSGFKTVSIKSYFLRLCTFLPI